MKILDSKCVFKGKILSVDVANIQMNEGCVEREIVHHRPAIAVLARRKDGVYVLVKQERAGAGRSLVEIVAGGIEDGEDEIEAVKRELGEETGYRTIGEPFKLASIVTIPGYCDEMVHLYYAEVENTPGKQHLDSDEYVHVVLLNQDEVCTMIDNGEIFDAKTIVAWYRAQEMKGRQAVSPNLNDNGINLKKELP